MTITEKNYSNELNVNLEFYIDVNNIFWIASQTFFTNF